jgi:hypothetical protein
MSPLSSVDNQSYDIALSNQDNEQLLLLYTSSNNKRASSVKEFDELSISLNDFDDDYEDFTVYTLDKECPIQNESKYSSILSDDDKEVDGSIESTSVFSEVDTVSWQWNESRILQSLNFVFVSWM